MAEPYVPPTVEDVVLRYPDLEVYDEDRLQALLNDAIDMVGPTWISRDRRKATMLLVAHWATSGETEGDPGNIQSESFGPISVSYGSSPSVGSNDFSSTGYGRQYVALRRLNFPGIAVV